MLKLYVSFSDIAYVTGKDVRDNLGAGGTSKSLDELEKFDTSMYTPKDKVVMIVLFPMVFTNLDFYSKNTHWYTSIIFC